MTSFSEDEGREVNKVELEESAKREGTKYWDFKFLKCYFYVLLLVSRGHHC